MTPQAALLSERIEIAAEAMWKLRAPEVGWRGTWQSFCREKPEIAAVYRQNARVAVAALNERAA